VINYVYVNKQIKYIQLITSICAQCVDKHVQRIRAIWCFFLSYENFTEFPVLLQGITRKSDFFRALNILKRYRVHSRWNFQDIIRIMSREVQNLRLKWGRKKVSSKQRKLQICSLRVELTFLTVTHSVDKCISWNCS